MKALRKNGNKLLFVFGFAAALMLLMPVLAFDELEFAGYEILIGKELVDVDPFGLGSVASAELPFSFDALLAFGLPLAGGLLALLSKRLLMLSAVFFIIGMVLLYRLPDTTQVVYTIAGNEYTTDIDWEMNVGLLAALALNGLALLTNLALLVFNK